MNFCKIKMTDKKSQKPSFSKNSIPIKKSTASVKNEPPFSPGLVTPSQLVPYDPYQITPIHSPIKAFTSRMVSLGKPVQQSQSFARALTSDYDPFAKKKALQAPTTQTQYVKSSPYLPIYSHKLFHIEFHHRNISNPLTLIKYYYPTNPANGAQLHFTPSDLQKTLQFYQDILQQEGSINITTLYDKFSNDRVLNHKLDIVKITALKTWGSHLFLLRPLQGHSIKYSYYDYIDAWSKILMYQDKNMSHSWFIQWNKEFNITKPECQIPIWFLKWWA
jgi:hypothetical protein